MAVGSTRNQYFAAIVLHVATFAYGCSVGWISPFASLLQSTDSPLNEPLTDDDISWVGGFFMLGGISGCCIYMYLVDVLGRKKAGFTILFPGLVQWIFILTAQKSFHLYIGRFLGGLAGGATFVIAPVMVAEFAEDHVRGSLGSILILAQNIGILFAYVVGSFVSYNAASYMYGTFSIMHAVLLLLIPETPLFLLQQGKDKEASYSLNWYRGYDENNKQPEERDSEFEKIRLSSTTRNSGNDCRQKFSIKDLITPLSLKGLTIGIVLMATQQASGMFAIFSYAASIFQDAGSSLSPNTSAIIVGTLLVVGSYSSTLLVERAGRKILLIASCLGTGGCLFVLATYTYLKVVCDYDVTTYNWIPVCSLSISVLLFACGLSPLAFVVASEIFAPKIRGFATPFCSLSGWIFTFISVKFYNDLSNALGPYGAEWLFSGCLVFGAIFIWLVVPETKGRPIQDILDDLSGN